MKHAAIAVLLLFFWQQPLINKISLEPLRTITANAAVAGFDWKVGDTLTFSMQLKPLPQKGTMVVKVTGDNKDGFILEEDVNVAFLKQKIEVLIDRNTGEVKKMKMNGKESPLPDGGSSKLLIEEESRITVPAGTFDCIHVVAEDAGHQQSETWLNPAEIPITGILKTKGAQGILEVNTELTSFARGP